MVFAKSTEAGIRILACGDTAMTVELSSEVDDEVNRRVIAFSRLLAREAIPGIVDVVATYRSFTVVYRPEILPSSQVRGHLQRILSIEPDQADPPRRIIIPVLYGCIETDLEMLSAEKDMSCGEIVDLHLSALYRVYMLGFAPGFAYLGGLPEQLHTPRRAVPRQKIEAGAIGIGGQQASISSVAGPSGWHFVGKTPVRLFQPSKPQPFLLQAGDEIRFRQIERMEYDDIDRRISSDAFHLSELIA